MEIDGVLEQIPEGHQSIAARPDPYPFIATYLRLGR